jgi:hypothetical protein
MSRTKRAAIAVGVLLALVATVAVEVGFRFFLPGEAIVEVINHGSAPMKDVVLSCDGREVGTDRIDVDESVRFTVSARGPRPLILRFRQPNSLFQDLQIDEFDATFLRSEDQRIVIELRDGDFIRYNEDDGTLVGGARKRLREELYRWTNLVR